MMELPEGTTLRSGTYRLERLLGQGGFGITYYGVEVALQRPVAIKEHFPYGSTRQGVEVQPGILGEEEYQASLLRFAQESRLLAQFDHPSIVKVLTVFEEARTSYLVMEFIDGLNLDEVVVHKGSLPQEQAVDYVVQACAALRVVHERGLLHRDIKPSNLLLRQDGKVVLIDFGSARRADLLKSTAMVSASYSPPELYTRGASFGPHTDVYSLAATLYYLLSGKPPTDCLQRLVGGPLEPAGSPALWATLQRGLSLDPNERFPSMADFLAALAPPVITRIVAQPEPVCEPPQGPQWGESMSGHRGWVGALAFSPDGRWLASGSEDKTVRLWSEGRPAACLEGHTGWVWGAVFSQEGDVLYTAGYDRQLLAWETGSWRRLAAQRCCDAVLCLARWGVWLAVGTLSGRIELRRLLKSEDGSELLRTVKLPGAINCCTFVQGYLAATAGDDRVYLIDLERGEVLERLKGHQGSVKSVTTLPDGRLVSGGSDRSVRLWDLDHGSSAPMLAHAGTVLALAPAAGGLVSSSGDKSVRLWTLRGDSRELGRHQGEVSALDCHGGWVASGGQDNMVRLWRVSESGGV